MTVSKQFGVFVVPFYGVIFSSDLVFLCKHVIFKTVIKLYRSAALMWPIVTDEVAWSVHQSVCWSVTIVSAEATNMPFGLWTRVGPRKHALGGGAHLRHLTNTIEPSVCGGNAAFLSNYFDHLLNIPFIFCV